MERDYNYHRRHSWSVDVGGIPLGGENPIRIQSMTSTSTDDIEASRAQAERIADAGASYVRLTTQGVKEADAIGKIRTLMRADGYTTPLVADIHFNPAAAFAAAAVTDKVRINPGNFVDPARTFKKLEYTDEEYAAEIERIGNALRPFIDICRQHGTAVRIGVNHGSLSDRIMSRYGSGDLGMVESAMEYLDICHRHGFDRVVVSIKASDVAIMVRTVRRLAETMDAYGFRYPLHLGVTEAGNELEGRVKSAVGIGTLLMDGIGDTIRVSLSEDPCAEIPVARELLHHVEANLAAASMPAQRRPEPRFAAVPSIVDADGDFPAGLPVHSASSGNRIASLLGQSAGDETFAVDLEYPASMAPEETVIAAAVDMGYLILGGRVAAIRLKAPSLEAEKSAELCRQIVQATGLARFKAEIVACPGCGRTLYELPEALARVKEACGHLKHLKIAVMGCIVNGPGEMADADYGYVGAAAGNVSIYRRTEPVVKNVPQDQAIDRLIELIKADGQWTDPA